ncbi:MAG: DUF1428 domain-containing protein [Pseudomonadota bacterium]
MSYVDGYVIPVPTADADAYRSFAARYAPLFKQYGATRVVESWGDDVPAGEVTDFFRAVGAKDGETVVFSWIEWPDKKARDDGMARAMEDPAFAEDGVQMPFDGKRMIMGGFSVIVDD